MPKLLIIILFLPCWLDVSGQLTANFSTDVTGGCGPLVVHFTNQTNGASGSATYSWNFGDGNSAVAANPEAVYTQPGSYTVVLTVQDGGQHSAASRTVTVYPAPTVGFTVSVMKACPPAPIQFTATGNGGAGGGGSIVSYLWDFGDGSTQSGAAASVGHAYQAAGTEGSA